MKNTTKSIYGGRGKCNYCKEWHNNVAYHEEWECLKRKVDWLFKREKLLERNKSQLEFDFMDIEDDERQSEFDFVGGQI